MTKPRYYITTPIYYVNDAPHIGHAYTSLACDVMARFKRLDGFDVMFLTGTDEHGQKVETAASTAGMEPQAFTDLVSQNFRDLLPAMKISNDDFIRTTEERHRRSCQEIWRRLIENGHIYLDTYSGWYSVRDEAYFAESELQDGKAPTGAPVEWLEEPSYFFALSKWQDRLLAFYDANPEFIAPAGRRNEVISFVSAGLRDLSISRTSFKWGIPVPDDNAHIMYVWLDALTNYITATGFPDTDAPGYHRFWPADIHMVGKDILRFHAIYWPAFLMAADLDPPRRVFAHGWWTNEGEKISKSLGNVINPLDLIESYGLDQVRYFLMREVPFGNDGDFSRTAIINRMNSDLANDLGNLCQRVLSFIARHGDSTVPAPGALEDEDRQIMATADTLIERLRAEFENQAFNRALESIWSLVADANRYIDAQAPWALRKTDPERMSTVLYVLCEVIRQLAIMVQPVVPDAASRILDQLALEHGARDFRCLGADNRLVPGIMLPAPTPVFPRFSEAR